MCSTVRPRSERLPREVWVIVSANFVIALGYGLVAPALPTFARGFGVTVTAATAVVSVFALARLTFAPVSGRLVTLLGERRVYLAGLIIVAVTTGACALATAYWHLLVLRTLSGIGSTMFTVSAIGLVIRLTPAPLRGRASGLWGTSFLLGTVAGPVIGGGLIAISLRAPFVVYAATLLVASAIVWRFLRHSALAEPPAAGEATVTLRTALRHRTYRAALAASFANGWTAFGVRVALTPLFITEVLHRPDAFAGTAFAVFGAANVAMLLFSGGCPTRSAESRWHWPGWCWPPRGRPGWGSPPRYRPSWRPRSSPASAPAYSRRRNRPSWPTSSAGRHAAARCWRRFR